MVILGPSGSGKSTLIRTINALEPIDEGTLIVNGHNVTEASAKDLVELRKGSRYGLPTLQPLPSQNRS